MATDWKKFWRWLPAFRRLDDERARLAGTLAQREAEGAVQQAELVRLRSERAGWARFFPPGHFYSPLPSLEEIAETFAHGTFGPPFPALELNEAGQHARLDRFASHYAEQPFTRTPGPGRRYGWDNPSYGAFDAIMLHGMLREARPRRIIEIGSGHSSAAMLDLNEQVLGGAVQFTFIDPDMARLRPLLRPDDAARVTLIEQRVQAVPLDAFATLGENDVLFVDSSHVSKIGSDVNRIVFDILPALAPGVLVHFHDIVGNLEYPRDWLEQGRAWNEQYLLRAFLMYNRSWRIELFTTWLWIEREGFIKERMPLCAQGGGGQLWLRKLER